MRELKENVRRSAVFTYGRFNPPHVGHSLVVKEMNAIKQSVGGPALVFMSHTYDDKKNLLTLKEKAYYFKRMFPNAHLITNKYSKTLFDAISYLGDNGYTDLYMIVGGDRADDFRSSMSNINFNDYGVETIEFISSGKRNPRSNNPYERASSSLVREAVRTNDWRLFSELTFLLDEPSQLSLFNTLSERLQVDYEMDKLSTLLSY